MDSHQSVVLCVVYAMFLMLGGVMFMYLEHEMSETIEVTEPPEWTRLKEVALQVEPPPDEGELLSLALWLPKACPDIENTTVHTLVVPGQRVYAINEVERECPHLHVENVTVEVRYPWGFMDALFFSMTVITTIGYGNISPSQAPAQITCILYSLVGIPLTGILLAWSSEFFGEQLFKLFKSKLDVQKQHSRGVIAMATAIYIFIGFVVFIFIPGAVFVTLEEWTYVESIYYAYITLTTIGFGDLVPGQGYDGWSLCIYQICVILWVLIGLGYWVMVANFITKALKSKKLQSSVMRSAEEMRKIMQQMGIKQHDPTFLRQHSKATLNLMLQLSNIIAVQGGGMDNGIGVNGSGPSSPGGHSSPSSPPLSPIPGISALFGNGLSRSAPLSHLMGPMRREENDESKCTEEITTVTLAMRCISREKKPVTYEQTIDLSDESPASLEVTTNDEVDLYHQTDEVKFRSSKSSSFDLLDSSFGQFSSFEPKDSILKPKASFLKVNGSQTTLSSQSKCEVMLSLDTEAMS